MCIVGFSELQQQANANQVKLGLISVELVAIGQGALVAAEQGNAPLAMAVEGDKMSDGVLLALEAPARQAGVPVALIGSKIQNTDQVNLAIRYGCSAVSIDNSTSSELKQEITAIAESGGISVYTDRGLSDLVVSIEPEFENQLLSEISAQCSSISQMNELIQGRIKQFVSEHLGQLNLLAKGKELLNGCSPWHPVEHLIIYNTNTDEAASRQLASIGRKVLDNIPGVRATWSGQSVKADAAYRWCWLIRFAHPKVIDSYREHPDHVAYADNHFRPAAADRISIDYELFGPEEN